MPSLKMKTKSTMGCLIENNGLHVCQKSSKISKTSFSHVKNFQQEAQLQTCISHKQDDSFCSEVIVQEIRSNKANSCEMIDEENLQDHTQANCSSAIETIFSPILESIDNDKGLNAYDHRGNENDCLDVPSLEDNESDSSSRNSGEYQSCNVSDFLISDMIVSSPPIERGSTFATIIEPTCLLGYECDESSRIFDDEVMLLPFPKDSDDDRRNYSEESSLYMAIHQLRYCNQEPDVNTYPDWDLTDYLDPDPQMFIRNLPDLSELATDCHPTILPQEPQETKSITLVLDLDETLVHSSLEPCNDADFTFPVFINMKEHTVYVKQRPYLRAFLEKVSNMFQIVVFTASQSIYAKQLLDILDPDGNIISRRAYRDSCIFVDGCYTKDLTVLGVDLAKVAIIDNSPQVFRLQVNNGIPIESWFNDPSDRALISLLPFLETLVDAQDVRPIISNKFGNKE